MLKHGWTAALYMILSVPALAHHREGHVLPPQAQGNPGGNAVSVPEIDASAGLLAVAAVATALLFIWERRRRQRVTQPD